MNHSDDVSIRRFRESDLDQLVRPACVPSADVQGPRKLNGVQTRGVVGVGHGQMTPQATIHLRFARVGFWE